MSRLIDGDKLLKHFCDNCGVQYVNRNCYRDCSVAEAIDRMPIVHPNCRNCKHYAEFEGVCCNADSEWVAEFRDSDNICNEWESK